MRPPIQKYPKSQVKEMLSGKIALAGSALLAARLHLDFVKPIVEKYSTDILTKHQFTNKMQVENARKRGKEFEVRVITEMKHSFLMSDEDFEIYLRECKEARVASGLHVDNPDTCPMLVAESMVCDAERLLLDLMEPLLGFGSNSPGLWRDDNRKKAIDISLGLIGHFGLFENIMTKPVL